MKKDQQNFMDRISEVIGSAQAGVDEKITDLTEKLRNKPTSSLPSERT